MKKNEIFSHEGLFQIGQVARCCGVSRDTILFYEKKGLISPSLVNEASGYRYYSPETVTELIQILGLRDAGFSVREIGEYFRSPGAEVGGRMISRINAQIAALTANLEMARGMAVKKGDYSVSWLTLPKMRCFFRERVCADVREATEAVYETLCEALSLGLRLKSGLDAFAVFPDTLDGAPALKAFKMRVCVPVDEEAGAELTDLPSESAICVYHRGEYEKIGGAYEALSLFARENGLRRTGPVREVYLDSRREYENEVDRYVTRVLLPVEDRRRN